MHVSSLTTRILVSSSEILLENLKDSKSEALQLKTNNIVEAKVAKVLSNGTAKLSIAGQTVVAKTHVLLNEGETIKLKVISDGDAKVLKLVEPNSGDLAPEGLKEMRALGRSGLYSKLTKVLDEYLPSQEKQTPKTLHKDDLQPLLNKKNSNVELKNSITNKTTVASEIKPFNVLNLKTLIDNKNISWPEKAASVIINSESKNTVIPPKMIERFVEKLVLPFSKESTPEIQKTLSNQLGEISKKMEARLSVKDTNLINSVVKDERVPWEYKLLALLSSKKNTVPAEESLPIQKILLKSLTQSGYVIKNDLLSSDFVDVNSGSGYSTSKSLHVVKKLENLLNFLSLKPESEPDDESLKSIVKNSGLMWEKKLSSVIKSFKEPLTLRDAENLINNDIKALAMKLAMVADGEEKHVGKTLRSFVDGLEKMQILNTHSSEESGRYLLPLPFFLNDTLKFGQLLVDLDRNRKSDKDPNDKAIRVAFILEMTRLGHLKADFSIYKKSISGEFGVENDEVQKLFNQLIPGLKEKLEEKEYVVKKIGCNVISSGELAGTSLTDQVIDSPSGVINIVV